MSKQNYFAVVSLLQQTDVMTKLLLQRCKHEKMTILLNRMIIIVQQWSRVSFVD
jgi:hypothetical protein